MLRFAASIGFFWLSYFCGYMHAGHLPDSFGHPMQMPQFPNDFGIAKNTFANTHRIAPRYPSHVILLVCIYESEDRFLPC